MKEQEEITPNIRSQTFEPDVRTCTRGHVGKAHRGIIFRLQRFNVIFTDDMIRVTWIVLMENKDMVTEALQHIVKEMADLEGLFMGRIRCNGVREFKGHFAELAPSLCTKMEASPHYVPQENSIAERGFGTIIGITRSSR